jgi:glycosyltransferase involved in cell wall biosynthesis
MFAGGALRLVMELVKRPAIVHIHASADGSFYRKAFLFRLCRIARVPTVLHIHSGTFEEFYDASGSFVRRVVRRTLRDSDAVIALGPFWQKRLQAIAPGADVRALPNGVAHRSARPVEQPETGVHVVYVGQIGEHKGTFRLLEAWGALHRPTDIVPPRLTIAGDGAIDRARQQREELPDPTSVDIRSWMPPADVAALLDSAHVLVLPSTHEGQPMSVIEAMARGLCVVASDVGGIPDLIQDGSTGLLVPADDPVRLAAALRRVMDDVALRRQLGAAAWRASAQLDLKVIAKRIDEVYTDVLDSRQKHPNAGAARVTAVTR